MSALPSPCPPLRRECAVGALTLPRGLMALHTRHLATASRNAYFALLAAIDETGNALLADDEALAAVFGLSLARWRRVQADLLLRGKIAVLDRETDDKGRVLHPGWIEIPWYTEALDTAEEERAKRSGAGRRSGEVRRRVDASDGVANAAEGMNGVPPNAVETVNTVGENTPVSSNIVPLSPLSLERERERDKQELSKLQALTPAPVSKTLPEGWTVPEDWLPVAAAARQRAGLPPVNLRAEAAKFEAHNRERGGQSRDWSASFVKWVLGAKAALDAAANGTMGTTGGGAANTVRENTGETRNAVPVPEPFVGHIDATTWTAWLAECAFTGPENGTLTVTAPTDFIRARIQSHYADTLGRATGAREVEVVVRGKTNKRS